MAASVGAMGITPDSKDWTWVLQRRCEDCGFQAATVPVHQVGAQLRSQVPLWTAALMAAGANQRTSPDRWSRLEYGCHVRDVCELYQVRLDLMLDDEDPCYPNWDQDETALADRYSTQDPITVAKQLDHAANGLADSFDALSDEQWRRPGRRSDGAVFTVDTFSRYFLHDVVHHGWDIC